MHFQAKMINGPCHNLFFHFFIRLGDDERPGTLHPPDWSRPLGPSVPPVVPWALPNNWLLAQPAALISAGSSFQRQPGQQGQHSGSWLVTHGPAWVGVRDVWPSHNTKQMQVIIISGKCTKAGMLWFEFSSSRVSLLLSAVVKEVITILKWKYRYRSIKCIK